MNRAAAILAGIGFVAALGLAGHLDQLERERLDDHYCQMVALWEAHRKAHAGQVGREIAAQRPGWPPHRDVDCSFSNR